MKRIHITGLAGSGKSYLAKKLSVTTTIPVYELDTIFWDNSSDKYTTVQIPEIRDKMLEKYCATEKWIIEGVYYTWCDMAFENADIIIYIDAPLFLCRLRVISRFLYRKFNLKRKYRDTISSTIKLLKWMRKYKEEDIPAINTKMKKYKTKLLIAKNAGDALKRITEINNCGVYLPVLFSFLNIKK